MIDERIRRKCNTCNNYFLEEETCICGACLKCCNHQMTRKYGLKEK